MRPLGKITEDLEPLLFEMVINHKLQCHEILGIVYLWVQVHAPGAIEVYQDGSNPVLKYGPKES
jgi:hypothetical protein